MEKMKIKITGITSLLGFNGDIKSLIRNCILIIFIGITLLLSSTNCPAQTKKETEDWILYYMRKNFSNDYAMARIGKTNSNGGDGCRYYQYKFSGSNLIINRELYKIDQSGEITDLIVDETFTIDLSKVIKIEKYSFIIDTTTYDNPDLFHHDASQALIEFVFPDLVYISENKVKLPLPVKVRNNFSNENAYQNSYQIIDTKDRDIIESGIIDRLIRAFENLVKLDGGKILKEFY